MAIALPNFYKGGWRCSYFKKPTLMGREKKSRNRVASQILWQALLVSALGEVPHEAPNKYITVPINHLR